MMRKPTSFAFGLCFALLGYCSVSANQSWIGWRNGQPESTWSPSATLDADYNSEPRRIWTKSVGQGYGGLTISGNRLFLMDRQTKPKEQERILCIDTETGQQQWITSYDVVYGEMGGYSTGPRTTGYIAKTTQGDVLITLGATGMIHGVSPETGTIRWNLNATGKLRAKMPQWGFSASPIGYDEYVLLHIGEEAGGSVTAIDPTSGTVVWQAGSEKAGYSPPKPAQIEGADLLIQWGPDHIEAIDPVQRTKKWAYPYKITYGVSIADPIIKDNVVLVSGYWHGTKVISIDPAQPTSPKLLWENERDLCGLMSSPMEKDGYVYLLDKNNGFTCFRFADGHIMWADKSHQLTKKERNPHASIVWMDKAKDRVALLNAGGELIYAEFKPTGFEELGRHQIIDKTWAHPAFVGNRIYARSDTQVVAWELWK